MHILMPTDVFPPKCGGAGWSSHALALALIGRGHAVTALVPRAGGPRWMAENVLGVPTVRLGYRAPDLAFVKNYFRHEHLWPRVAQAIIDCADDQHAATDVGLPISDFRLLTQLAIENRQSNIAHSVLIHAQHVQVMPAAIMAGKRLGVPVVVTVRDHWPWDYFATGLHGNQVPYSQHGWAALATDLVAREGPLKGAAAAIAIPYIRAHMRRRLAFLRQADAVIAVSGYIARRLETLVPRERIHVIPNMVDVAAIARVVSAPPQSVAAPYLLFVGKLDRNKGADLLVDVFRAYLALETGTNRESEPHIPTLVIAGDGPLRPLLERDLAALGVSVRFLDWIDHDEVLRLMAHCTLLLFPSAWGEPLSRVWLEAAACGAPLLAMPTGGIHDIIADGVNGALAATPAAFARRMAALLADELTRRRLGAAARQTARERFAVEHVVGQVEALYAALVENQSQP